jgi:hypothetical protein
MALGSQPYTAKITGKALDGAGTGWLLTIEVRDNAGALRLSTTVDVGQTQLFSEMLDCIREQVGRALEQDAGNRSALLDAAITAGVKIGLV